MSLMTEVAWQGKAACRGPQARMFFPPVTTERKEEKRRREERAKEICMACPVLADCRNYSVEIREQHGIWGGLNERERKAIFANAN